MAETNDYIDAWTDEDKQQGESHPVTEAVMAAQKADKNAFADAFENDRFGIDLDKAEKADEEAKADQAEKTAKDEKKPADKAEAKTEPETKQLA